MSVDACLASGRSCLSVHLVPLKPTLLRRATYLPDCIVIVHTGRDYPSGGDCLKPRDKAWPDMPLKFDSNGIQTQS